MGLIVIGMMMGRSQCPRPRGLRPRRRSLRGGGGDEVNIVVIIFRSVVSLCRTWFGFVLGLLLLYEKCIVCGLHYNLDRTKSNNK